MQPFAFHRADDVAGALRLAAADPRAAFLAGGTTEVDLLRLGVRTTSSLIDINRLPLNAIEEDQAGGLRIGALARMSDVAAHPIVRKEWPMIARALELGASAQIRNMASMGGNMLQAVRCGYFRDPLSPCNKRERATGCAAIGGVNRGHAVLGTSPHCIATHPSDVAVALVAADAVIHIAGPDGERRVAVADFFLEPGETPDREHPIARTELVVAITLPPLPVARHSTYLKVRDRESYEFALSSAAAALRIEGGLIAEVRLALGGIATKPWRAGKAEAVLVGSPPTPERFREAAEAELAGAVPQTMNAFKIELAKRTIVRVLSTLGGL